MDNKYIKYYNKYKKEYIKLKRQQSSTSEFNIYNYIIKMKQKPTIFTIANSDVKYLHYNFGDISDDKEIQQIDNPEKKLNAVNIKYKKYIDYNVKTSPCDNNCKLPDHFCIIDSVYTKKELKNVFNLLETTFINNKNHPAFSHQENKNRTFMFDNSTVYNTIKTAYILNKDLGIFFATHISNIIKMLNIKDEDIEKILYKSMLVVARYENLTGLYSHIDKLGRANGPVITLSIGPEETIYDLIPLDASKDNSYRVIIKEGQIVFMDGISRLHWFHSLPYNYKYTQNIRYSIIILTNRYDIIEKIFSKFWNRPIIVSSEPCKNPNYKNI